MTKITIRGQSARTDNIASAQFIKTIKAHIILDRAPAAHLFTKVLTRLTMAGSILKNYSIHPKLFVSDLFRYG